MARELDDLIAKTVRKWMSENGIDPNQVITYTVNKTHDDLATIDIRMYMQEKEVANNG